MGENSVDRVTGPQSKFNNAIELRDSVDLLCTGATYAIFLKKLVPVFTKLLEGPPVFMSTSWEHVSAVVAVAQLNTRRLTLHLLPSDCGIASSRYSTDYR